MKKACLSLVCILVTILGSTQAIHSQPTGSISRVALRLNTLSFLNLSVVGEVEYSITARWGLFFGAGYGVNSAFPVKVVRYLRTPTTDCEMSGSGLYAGVRIGTPIWKLSGLAVKGMMVFSHYRSDGAGCDVITDVPALPDPYIYNSLGLYPCIAYQQTFLRRAFVEPVVGVGPELVSLQGSPKLSYLTWGIAMQLNLGLRF